MIDINKDLTQWFINSFIKGLTKQTKEQELILKTKNQQQEYTNQLEN